MKTSVRRAVTACALLVGTATISLTGSGMAYAAETIAYRYDIKGRLVQVAHSGSTNNGVVTNYAFDESDNRTGLTVTGSAFNSPSQRILVVPLNGMMVIALPSS